jgi:hypothetical protein
LDEGAYLHIGSEEPVIKVVGVPKADVAASK